MCEDPPYDRRRFLGITAMTMAAAHLGTREVANAQSRPTPPAALPTTPPGTHTSFGALKHIVTGVLQVGYAAVPPWSGGHSSARLAVRHLQLCRRGPDAGGGRLPCLSRTRRGTTRLN
jgi:hypothetical protein